MTRAATGSGWRGAVRGNVLMLGVVSLCTDLSSEMIYPLLPVFFTGLVPAAMAPIYVGLMDGLAESVSSILKIVSGRLSDALGKRKALAVAGYGISSVARPLMALAGAGWHVILLRFLDRIGKGVRTSPRDALLSDSVEPEVRGLAFSFHRAMDHLGAVLGPLAAIAVLYALLGYGLWAHGHAQATPDEMRALRWLFGLALLPGLAAMGALVGRVREIVPQRPMTEATTGGRARKGPRLPGRFYFYVTSVGLFALGNSSDLFLVYYARVRFQLPLLHLIGVWIVLHLSKIVFSLPGGAISDRIGRRPVIILGWLVYAMIYLGMAVVADLWLFWLLIVGYGLYYGMTEGAEKALVADFVASEHRGTAYGVYHAVVGLAALPASLLFGVFWSVLGPGLAFGIGASLAGLAGLLLVFCPQQRAVAGGTGER